MSDHFEYAKYDFWPVHYLDYQLELKAEIDAWLTILSNTELWGATEVQHISVSMCWLIFISNIPNLPQP